MRGGKRPGAGRPKGSTNDAIERERQAWLDAIAQVKRVKDPAGVLRSELVRRAFKDKKDSRLLIELKNSALGKPPLAITGDLEVNLRNQVYRCVDEAGKDDDPGGGD